jgi:NodT family efflux transporter outer membrane factor (OMF) lipoprotein
MFRQTAWPPWVASRINPSVCAFAVLRAVPAALALALGACSLVPDYHRPETPKPQAWAQPADPSLADAIPVRDGWWRSFGDAQLNALVERSLQNSFTLASAVAKVDQARAEAERVGAALYPALTLNGALDRTETPGKPLSHSQSLFAQASYEIDFWGLNAANANAARRQAQASEFDRDTAALSLTASVTDTYFEIQGLRRRVDLARQVSADAQKTLDLLVAQQGAGVATQLQIEQQRNALATFQAAVPALQQQLDQNLHMLAVLVGTAPEGFAIDDAQLGQIPVPTPKPDLPSALLETRPDIRSKESQLQAANYSVGAARAAFFPNISLTAQGGRGSNSLSHFLGSPLSTLEASLAAPIFDGGALRGQLHEQQAVVRQNIADYRQAVVAAMQDVEDSLSSAQHERDVEVSVQVADDAARKAYSLAQEQYKYGTIDFLTVLDTQRTLYQAEDTLVQTRLQRLQSAVSIFRAFGGGVELTDGQPRPSENFSYRDTPTGPIER